MKKLITMGLAAVLSAVVTGKASAQLAGIYVPPQCDLQVKHFLVKNAQAYVKSATEAREPEKRAEHLQDAQRVLMEALERGEEGNPSVWYFLARYYMLVPDYQGADTAFAKVEAMVPDCREDIDTHRQFGWTSVYNEAVEALNANDLETAKRALSAADAIYHKEPLVPYYLASVYINLGDHEGSLPFFKEVVELGDELGLDTGDYAEPYEQSMFNAARIHHMLGEFDSAAVWYERMRERNPDDPDVLTGLASAYESAGRPDDAVGIYGALMDRADSLTVGQLFTIGVSLFQGERFEQAARAFQLGLERSPYHRDGLFNLTQAYFNVASPDLPQGEEAPEATEAQNQAARQMLASAKRLVAIDQWNTQSLRLLAAAYQLMGQEDSTIAVLTRARDLPYQVDILMFQETEAGYEVRGTITNRMEEELTVPALEFDFLGADGQVITTETVDSRVLAPNESGEFQLTPMAQNVAGWRYRLASGP